MAAKTKETAEVYPGGHDRWGYRIYDGDGNLIAEQDGSFIDAQHAEDALLALYPGADVTVEEVEEE